MALPKLNETPKYTMTIPSTGKKVNFRPYLVKEEKILLIAAETNDMQQSVNAISDTVVACVSDDIDPNKLSTFDLEYMFMKIRSKSVGEKVELTIPCTNCESPIPFEFDLDEIKVDDVEFTKNVQITDTISLDLRWPSYSNLNLHSDNIGFEMIVSTIEAVCTEDERIQIDDEPEESVREFLDNLTTEQFKMVAEVVEKIPRVYFLIDKVCRNCDTHVEQKIEGLHNFFR